MHERNVKYSLTFATQALVEYMTCLWQYSQSNEVNIVQNVSKGDSTWSQQRKEHILTHVYAVNLSVGRTTPPIASTHWRSRLRLTVRRPLQCPKWKIDTKRRRKGQSRPSSRTHEEEQVIHFDSVQVVFWLVDRHRAIRTTQMSSTSFIYSSGLMISPRYFMCIVFSQRPAEYVRAV